MIEPYFLKKQEEYQADPSEGKLDELEFIQEERRIQNPFKFILITREETKLRMSEK